VLDSLDGVGLKFRPDVPFDANLLVKFFFRDANPQAVAQSESKKRREDYKKKEELRTKCLYVGDRVDVTTRNLIGIRSTRKGEITETSSDDVHVKYTNGKVELVKREFVKLQKSRSPIDAWPDAFIFFERVLGLLRGLTASLDVSQSYMDVMTPYARISLERHYKSIPPTADNIIAQTVNLDSIGGVEELVNDLISSGDILGCQVVCLKVIHLTCPFAY